MYKKSKGLYLLWEKNKSHLLDHDKNKIFGANDLFFMWLTNNGFLYKVGPVINTMLSDNENHERFLLKLEEIEGLSKEIKFAFSRSEKNDISLFVHLYGELLGLMYKYQIALSKERETNKMFQNQIKISEVSLEETRLEVINKINELNSVFQKIE